MERERADARPSASDVVSAHERWAYEEGRTVGLHVGKGQGFDEGYRAGFDAGAAIAAKRVLAALETTLGGQLPQLLPWLPHLERYIPYLGRAAQAEETRDSRAANHDVEVRRRRDWRGNTS
jgi:hypothetical protein